MVDFIETPRFPDNIAEGSGGGPQFKTDVFESYGGSEQRTQVWSKMRAKFDVAYGIRDRADMDIVRDFFYDCRGRAVGFRFKDWSDYNLVDEQIGTGDGVTAAFTIIKTYGTNNPYVRRIFKPVSGTVVVKVNSVVQTLTTDYTINHTTGIITFTVGHIPAAAAVVAVTCEFDVPVRFDTDHLNPEHDGWRSETWSSIPVIELKLEEPA